MARDRRRCRSTPASRTVLQTNSEQIDAISYRIWPDIKFIEDHSSSGWHFWLIKMLHYDSPRYKAKNQIAHLVDIK